MLLYYSIITDKTVKKKQYGLHNWTWEFPKKPGFFKKTRVGWFFFKKPGFLTTLVSAGQPSIASDVPGRLDGLGHFMKKTAKSALSERTTSMCTENRHPGNAKCVPSIPLCDIPCHEIYHTRLDYKHYWKAIFYNK